jgi:hypothetical protein
VVSTLLASCWGAWRLCVCSVAGAVVVCGSVASYCAMACFFVVGLVSGHCLGSSRRWLACFSSGSNAWGVWCKGSWLSFALEPDTVLVQGLPTSSSASLDLMSTSSIEEWSVQSAVLPLLPAFVHVYGWPSSCWADVPRLHGML